MRIKSPTNLRQLTQQSSLFPVSPVSLSRHLPLAVNRVCAFYTSSGLATEKGARSVAKRNFNHIPPAEVTIRRLFVGVREGERRRRIGDGKTCCLSLHCKRRTALCSSRWPFQARDLESMAVFFFFFSLT